MMKHSLTIYDDPVFYIQGLTSLLLQNEIFDAVLQYSSKKEFLENFRNKPTDFAILGSHQNGIHEIMDTIVDITGIYSNVKIIVIGNYFDLNDIRKLFEKGIQCYLDKDTNFDEFSEAMKMLKSNKIYVCNSAKERMVGYISHQNQNEHQNTESLTRREIEVMKLICEGHSSKIISEKLFISINTVESHRKKILMKLNVKNSIGIVKYAVENNMLE